MEAGAEARLEAGPAEGAEGESLGRPTATDADGPGKHCVGPSATGSPAAGIEADPEAELRPWSVCSFLRSSFFFPATTTLPTVPSAEVAPVPQPARSQGAAKLKLPTPSA